MNQHALGYCGVIVPEASFWQGYFLDRRMMPSAVESIRVMRGHADGVRVIEPPAFVTDQDLVGAFAASLVEGALTANFGLIGNSALAIYLLTGCEYFTVIGHRGPEGTRTKLDSLEATSIEEAREIIEQNPLLDSIKQTLRNEFRKPHN